MEMKSLEKSCLSQRFRKMSGGDKNQKGFSKCLIMGKENRSFNGAALLELVLFIPKLVSTSPYPISTC